jgi:hypothetical protein
VSNGAEEYLCDNWIGPGVSAANTDVSPGPDLSIDLDVSERGPASTMVEPTSTPAIHPATDSWAHEHIARSQTCPVCLGAVVKHATRKNNGVMLATYVCAMDHLWSIHWGLAQVAA